MRPESRPKHFATVRPVPTGLKPGLQDVLADARDIAPLPDWRDVFTESRYHPHGWARVLVITFGAE